MAREKTYQAPYSREFGEKLGISVDVVKKYGLESVKAALEEKKLKVLYYMAPLSNAPTILVDGILCRKLAKARSLVMGDISNVEVQVKRKSKKVVGTNLDLHWFVPLYFTAFSPMRNIVLFGKAGSPPTIDKENLVFFEIDALSVFTDIRGLRFTDGNAASQGKKFYVDVVHDIDKLNWGAIRMQEYREDYKAKQAEVLVPKQVPLEMICRAITCSNNARKNLQIEYESELARNNSDSSCNRIPIECDESYYSY